MLMGTASDLHSAAQQGTKPSAVFLGLILFQRPAVYYSSVSIALVKELLQKPLSIGLSLTPFNRTWKQDAFLFIDGKPRDVP
jgi:hypothetical protein